MEKGAERDQKWPVDFSVSGSRIPKISDFCEKRNENPQTRFAQTVWIFVSTQNSEIKDF